VSVAFNSDIDLTVEVGFASDPFDSSQTFTDISSYVREISIDRGRQHDLDEFQTGVATVLVNNIDDRFNPLNTSSAYYPNIKPFKQIKISATYSGSTKVLYRGFIQSYPESFGGQGADSSVRIVCVDAFKIFNLNTIGSRGWNLGQSGFSNIGQSTRLGYVDAQELSSARITRLLNAFGWSSTQRDISTGDLQVKAGVSLETNLLTALKDVETAEQGQFFIGADGDVVFRDRNYKRGQQFTSQATFGNGVGELPFSDVITTLDDSRIVNIVSVTRDGGSEQRLANDSSIAEFGARENSLTGTLNVSDSDALAIAEQRLASFKGTTSRIEGLIINPIADSNIWAQVLNRELGDKITIKIPTPASTTMEFDVHIEKISQQINAINQTWTYSLSTSAGSEVGAWILGSGKLGQSTNLAW
jgi:hypothetical protein|tara:strand:- start:9367 stop:10614 length:1248 start_codon:yes stop_codon:yes gene_type:complete